MTPRPLAQALAALATPEEAERFLADLCTPAEIHAMEERWLVAQHLAEGTPYREVGRVAHASTTTVVRVARYLNTMPHGGYRMLIERLAEPQA